jgi:hypothetical protein
MGLRGVSAPKAFGKDMPSTVIRAARYDPDRELLDIRFTTGRRYLYRGVPPAEAEGFGAAISKGRYFNLRIRDRYEFVEVTEEAAESDA